MDDEDKNGFILTWIRHLSKKNHLPVNLLSKPKI